MDQQFISLNARQTWIIRFYLWTAGRHGPLDSIFRHQADMNHQIPSLDTRQTGVNILSFAHKAVRNQQFQTTVNQADMDQQFVIRKLVIYDTCINMVYPGKPSSQGSTVCMFGPTRQSIVCLFEHQADRDQQSVSLDTRQTGINSLSFGHQADMGQQFVSLDTRHTWVNSLSLWTPDMDQQFSLWTQGRPGSIVCLFGHQADRDQQFVSLETRQTAINSLSFIHQADMGQQFVSLDTRQTWVNSLSLWTPDMDQQFFSLDTRQTGANNLSLWTPDRQGSIVFPLDTRQTGINRLSFGHQADMDPQILSLDTRQTWIVLFNLWTPGRHGSLNFIFGHQADRDLQFETSKHQADMDQQPGHQSYMDQLGISLETYQNQQFVSLNTCQISCKCFQ